MESYNIGDELENQLEKFSIYLRDQRDRAPGTIKEYCCDVKIYAKFFFEEVSSKFSDFTIKPDYIISYLSYLKSPERKLSRETIKRRLIGLYAFWKFLFKTNQTKFPPVSLDDLDIIIKTNRNPTRPLSPQNYKHLREELTYDFAKIE